MLPAFVLNVKFYRNELIDCFINSKYDLFGIDFKIPYKMPYCILVKFNYICKQNILLMKRSQSRTQSIHCSGMKIQITLN